MFSNINKLESLFVNTYVLCVAFVLLCVVSLWKYLRICYYISKIPGPTAWPVIGNALILRSALKAETYFKMFKDNKGFFRLWLGPIPAVLVSDADVLQTFYTKSSSLNKGKLFEKLFSNVFRDTLMISKVEKWKRIRKICNYAFSPTILNSFVPTLNDISASLIAELKNEVNKTDPFDVNAYFRRATLDSICATAMGINLNSVKDTKSPLAQAMDSIIVNSVKRFCTISLYPFWIFNLSNTGKEQKKGLDVVWNLANKVFNTKTEYINSKNISNTINEKYKNIDKPIEKNPLKKPFLEFLIDMSEIHPELTEEQIKAETSLMLMAAYETSAVALSYAMVVFGARKDIQEKAYNEIFNIFKASDRCVEVDDLSEMKYLELVIKETLRLYPPIAHFIRETTDDIQLGNYIVPTGTTIFVSVAALQRNPNYWEKPMEFIPERFLDNRHPYAFIPFNSGPRNCIGGRYAMILMKLQLANILRKYEIHTDLKLDELAYGIDLSIKTQNGHLINITER